MKRLWTFVFVKLFANSLSTQALILFTSGISSGVYFFRSSAKLVSIWTLSCSGDIVKSLVVFSFLILNFLMKRLHYKSRENVFQQASSLLSKLLL